MEQLDSLSQMRVSVIPWSCPVPSFGDLSRATVATLGLNPSNREFVDASGNELGEGKRRFHTLSSLRLNRWTESGAQHVDLVSDSCKSYFQRNPYDAWFKRLEYIISGTCASYYGLWGSACHLDLIPFATQRKWGMLQQSERQLLLRVAGGSLGALLHKSPVRILVLNGISVVRSFEALARLTLQKTEMTEWALPRHAVARVTGFAFQGVMQRFADIPLTHNVLVLGFNHNIQSSFGVTNEVTAAIRHWIQERANAYL